MKLIAFSPQYLRLDDPLPFGLRDGTGRLLLAAGQSIPGSLRLEELRAQPLYTQEHEAAEWNRRLAAAVDTAMREGRSLRAVAAARPDTASRDIAANSSNLSWFEQWQELGAQLDIALRDLARDDGRDHGREVTGEIDWRTRLLGVHGRARQLFQRKPEWSLYTLFYESITSTRQYSSRHALLVLCVAEHAAGLLGWPQERIDSLGRAALTMNVSVMRLQDQLAQTQLAPTAAMMAEIEAHAEAGATLLQAAGLDDALCVQAVRLHRDPPVDERALDQRDQATQLAELLRRVDVFTAKLSLRASRAAMPPPLALREAARVVGGKPDEITGALLKAVGLYPPGSYVELAGGEIAIVLARGRVANQPLVAVLVGGSGLPLAEPQPRDTSDKRYAVKGAIAASTVKVRPSHDKLLR